MEDRLAKLERRCRHLTCVLTLLLTVGAVTALSGAADEKSDWIKTQGLSIQDEEGKDRILLSTIGDRAFLMIQSPKDKNQYELLAGPNFVQESFSDKDSKVRIVSKIGPDGTAFFTINDPRDKHRVGLMTDAKSNVGTFVTDLDGKPIENPFR